MCTMAWDMSGDELWICFNRDEQRSRPLAEPPVTAFHENGHASIFARDPEGGGTWLAVSNAGFAVALMNYYTGELLPTDNPSSRGTLVTALIKEESARAAETALDAMGPLKEFAPFYLFILGRNCARHWSWDGNVLEKSEECPRFWTTSSYKPEAVCAWRINVWNSLTADTTVSLARAAEMLRMVSPDPAYGMTMDRDDARTVSQTSVTIGKGITRMRYASRELNGLSYDDPVEATL